VDPDPAVEADRLETHNAVWAVYTSAAATTPVCCSITGGAADPGTASRYALTAAQSAYSIRDGS
jgi:hypothetical protein